MSRVPDAAQGLLKWAAVAGRELDTDLLRTRFIGIEALLEACADAAVLEIADGKWRFSHDKLRESLLSTLPTDEIPRLNREVAEAIELVYPHDDRRAAVLCEHWATANVPEKEAHYARLAGEQAHRLSVYPEALRYYARAQQIYGAQEPRTPHTGSAICLTGSGARISGSAICHKRLSISTKVRRTQPPLAIRNSGNGIGWAGLYQIAARPVSGSADGL